MQASHVGTFLYCCFWLYDVSNCLSSCLDSLIITMAYNMQLWANWTLSCPKLLVAQGVLSQSQNETRMKQAQTLLRLLLPSRCPWVPFQPSTKQKSLRPNVNFLLVCICAYQAAYLFSLLNHHPKKAHMPWFLNSLYPDRTCSPSKACWL